MIVSEKLIIHGEELQLTNQKAIVWTKENSLLISDIHLGKSAHFRKYGIPVPNQIVVADLKRLHSLITRFSIQHVIIVGDFFHAGINKEIELFNMWRNQFFNISFRLIKGNHDRLSYSTYQNIGIELYQKSIDIGPFTFTHLPVENAQEKFVIAGHIHPGVTLKGKGKQRIKLPCYLKNDFQLILPAFSNFTGLNTQFIHTNNYTPYCITEEAVFSW